MHHDIEAQTGADQGPEASSRSIGPADRRERYLDDPRKKSPLVAAILSAMPGLGQVYVGYYPQGFIHIIVIAALIGIIATNSIEGDLQGPLGFFIAFFWLYNVIDAARRASLYNQALSGLRPMSLPEDVNSPRPMGSLAGGLALIGTGLVLFSNTMFDVSLLWLADWWPMALVGAGAWLVYEDRRAKQSTTT